jgi:hypothetical protein
MPVPSTNPYGSPVSLMIMMGRAAGIDADSPPTKLHQKTRIPPTFPKLAER